MPPYNVGSGSERHKLPAQTFSYPCSRKGNQVTNIKHGHSSRRGRSSLYKCWESMCQRVTSKPSSHAFSRYAGRGITVVPEWTGVGGFERFLDYVLEHLGPHPGKGWSIDRENNDGNYEPGNLRWATASEQVFNRRKRSDSSSKYRGVRRRTTSGAWHSYALIDGKQGFLGAFSDELEAALIRDIAVVRCATPAILNFPELRPRYQQYVACEDALKDLAAE